MRTTQSGASLLVVLVLLTVLLLGGLTMARSGATGALIAGNTAYRGAALEASEVGLADAFDQVVALGAEDSNDPAAGYFALRQAEDPSGLPQISTTDWNGLPATTVGNYSVRHVVERLCTGTLPVTDAARQCVVRVMAQDSSNKVGAMHMAPAIGKQYRVTVNVTGPHDTQVFVQDMVVR